MSGFDFIENQVSRFIFKKFYHQRNLSTQLQNQLKCSRLKYIILRILRQIFKSKYLFDSGCCWHILFIGL